MSEDEAVDVDPETDEKGSEADEKGSEAEEKGSEADEKGSGPDGNDPRPDGVDADESDDGTSRVADLLEAEDTAALVDHVAEHDDTLAADVETLAEELERLDEELEAVTSERDEYEKEVDELTSRLARVRADFSNYKERAKRKREEIRERASESLVERIAPVRNDLLRALDQDDGSDIRPGVESTLEKFDEVLDEEGVEPIDPDPGTEVDPKRHQVMLRVDSDQPEGTVHEVYEPGYEMGDRVITEARITVSDGG